jgi:hypothetical protein
MTNTDRLPADLLAILNAPCPPLPAEMVRKLNEALNANLKEIAE